MNNQGISETFATRNRRMSRIGFIGIGNGATGVLFSITAGSDLALSEIHEAAAVIADSVDPDANIIFGVVPDKKADKDIKLTLIATGYESNTPSEETVVDEILQQALGDGDFDLPPFLRRKGRVVR